MRDLERSSLYIFNYIIELGNKHISQAFILCIYFMTLVLYVCFEKILTITDYIMVNAIFVLHSIVSQNMATTAVLVSN